MARGKHDMIKNIVVLRLCTCHLTKNLKNDIFKHFTKEHSLFIASLIGGIFDLKSFKEVDSYVKEFLTLLMCKKKNHQYSTALRKFEKFSQKDSWDEFNDFAYDPQFEEFELIFKSSKFFQIYNEFVKNFKDNGKSDKVASENDIYNPKFTAVFVKKYLAFLPFWSTCLSALRSEDPSRASNAYVEGITNLSFFKSFLILFIIIRLFWSSEARFKKTKIPSWKNQSWTLSRVHPQPN